MEKELRLTLEQVETILKQASLIDGEEAVSEVRIEPSELIVKVID